MTRFDNKFVDGRCPAFGAAHQSGTNTHQLTLHGERWNMQKIFAYFGVALLCDPILFGTQWANGRIRYVGWHLVNIQLETFLQIEHDTLGETKIGKE